MAIEKRELGTDSNPDVIPMGRAMEVTPEPSRQDLIREAAEILVTDDGILVDNEIDAPPEGPPAIPFDANLVDYVDDNSTPSYSTYTAPTKLPALFGTRKMS